MQLITLTIAALSIGTQVLAAPAQVKREIAVPAIPIVHSLPVVGSLVGRQVQTLPTDVLTTVGPLTAPVIDIVGGALDTVENVVPIATDLAARQLDSLTAPVAVVEPVLETVEETLESVPVVGETVDSVLRRSLPSIVDTQLTEETVASVDATVASLPVVNTIVSPISKRSTVSTVCSAVSGLVSTVTVQLNVISKVVDSTSAVKVPGLTDTPLLTVAVAPTVAKALTIVTSTLDATVAKVLPVLTNAVEPLVDAEIAAVGDLLGEVNELLTKVEAVVISLLKSVTAEVKPLLVNEIHAVLNAVTPLVAPITGFAFTIVGDVSATTAQITEVRSAAATVFATASGLVSPVGSVMKAL